MVFDASCSVLILWYCTWSLGIIELLAWIMSEWVKLLAQSCPTLCDPWIVAHQVPPSMGFSRQEYWSGLPFLSAGDLPDPGIEPRSSALQADALTSEPPGKPIEILKPVTAFITPGAWWFPATCKGSPSLSWDLHSVGNQIHPLWVCRKLCWQFLPKSFS